MCLFECVGVCLFVRLFERVFERVGMGVRAFVCTSVNKDESASVYECECG